MTKYKAGALSAFLSGKADEDPISESKEDNLFYKKSKKKPKRISKETDDASTTGGISATPTAEDEEPQSAESATSSKNKRQSYAKLMSEDEKKRTVFVGNLPVDVSEKTLKRLFAPCGSIDTIRLRSAIPNKQHLPKKAAIIKRELAEGQINLTAYVKFQAPESVQEALKLNGSLLDGRHVQVDACASGKRYDDKRTIFLGNLPFDANEEALYEHFSDCGDIEKVRLVRDRATGTGKGFGFVVFKEPTSVSFALRLNGEKFQNRDLRITRVVKKQKKKLATAAASSNRPAKKRQKDRIDFSQNSHQKTKEQAAVSGNKRPSKRVRELVKKRKAKKDRKSYMSTY